jgi:hypothetical protein
VVIEMGGAFTRGAVPRGTCDPAVRTASVSSFLALAVPVCQKTGEQCSFSPRHGALPRGTMQNVIRPEPAGARSSTTRFVLPRGPGRAELSKMGAVSAVIAPCARRRCFRGYPPLGIVCDPPRGARWSWPTSRRRFRQLGE